MSQFATLFVRETNMQILWLSLEPHQTSFIMLPR